MNQFAHLLRFFPTADDNKPVPGSSLTPTDAHPILPIVPGDTLRWLLPKADLAGRPLHRTEIVLVSALTQASLGTVGAARLQDSELYVQFDLTIDGLPTSGQQFALTRTINNLPVSVLGTVSGSFADLDSYIDRIQHVFEAYAHAPVVTFRRDNQLTVRVFKSPRFQPSDADLSGWYVDLGKVPASAYNPNSPAFTAQSLGPVVIPAVDAYTVLIGEDVEEGNVFSLQGVTYTATANDTADSVRQALGLPSDLIITLPSGSAVSLSAAAGVYRSENLNRPTLQLLFDSTSGGNDKYKAVVGADVQAGNIYQVSASGMTTRTVTATSTDTAATIAAQFNLVSGFLLIPTGQTPTALTTTGAVTIANTNLPTLSLTNKITTAAYTVDRYRLFVGSSVRRGNIFVTNRNGVETSITATSTDSALTIAQAHGFSTNPFLVDVPTGQPFGVYARRGSRYTSPDDVAPVRLTASPRYVRPDQLVGEVVIPKTITPGLYSLGLRDKNTRTVFALSNRLRAQSAAFDTAVLRWGSLPGMGMVFTYQYAEDGLTQQLRLPVYVGTARQKMQESQYSTPSGTVIRTDLSVQYNHVLTTDMQPAAFHRALLLALKHPRLTVDGVPYRCQSDYRESEPTPVRMLFNAQTDLTEIDAINYRPVHVDDLTGESAALIEQLIGTDELSGLWLKSQASLLPLRAGLTLSPADYTLLAFCSREPHRLLAYVNDRLIVDALLTANRLNRIPHVRLCPADRLLIKSEPVTATVTALTPIAAVPVATTQTTATETTVRSGDFVSDFNADFSN